VKTARAQMILGCLRKALQSQCAGLTDGQLLGRFIARRDEDAFGALVRRHGPMVFGVCRRILRHAQDAEDAFQAAFLVLARKASRLRDREAVGSWLYGVAYRAALGARASSLRRKVKEQQVETMPHPLVMPEEGQHELLAVLDRELARLPEKYRLPVVLCELEGRSRKEAARQLGLPEGTLSSRLATARKTLAKRMAGHGAAVTGASLTALFASEAGAAVVPGPLVASTVRAAGGVISAGVVALAEGVLKAMLLTKIKAAGLVLLLAASVGVGTVTMTYRTMAAEPQPKVVAARQLARAANPEKDDLEALRLEVEGLRLSLQATRERVKVLEAKELARTGPTDLDREAAVTELKVDRLDVNGVQPLLKSTEDELYSEVRLDKPLEKWATLVIESDPMAEIEAAAKILRKHPDDKKALDALDHAVERLKRRAEPKPAAESKPNHP
jgi:RNA polymerase sigma factor (sigma-70 family)